MMFANRGWWVGGFLVALVAGCGSSGPGAVRGVVKLDGKPVARAGVTFVAQTEGGRDAHGFTDANGEFRLTTFDPDDGALPGKYKVVIEQPADEVIGTPQTTSADEAMKAAAEGKVKVKRSAVVIPERYTKPIQTPLTQEIPASGPVILELQSK